MVTKWSLERYSDHLDFFPRAMAIINQMRSYGDQTTNQIIVEIFFSSLIPKFDHVVAAIEESKDLSNFSFDELMGSLQAHEARLNRSTEKHEEQAFKVKGEASYSDKLFMNHYDTNEVASNVWFVDNGYSNHMLGMKAIFKELVQTQKILVKLGDNKDIQVEGKGTVAIKTSNGKVKLMHDVQYVPSLAHNLLSVGN